MKTKLLLLSFFVFVSFSSNKELLAQCSGLETLTLVTDIVSDGSGNNDYSNDLDCQWLIQPTNAQYIYLEFTELNTEENNDIVYIYNGTTTSDPLIGTYSGYEGSSTRPKLLIESNSILVHFVTNSTVTDGGFKIEYEGVNGTIPTIDLPSVSNSALCPNSSVTVNFTTTGVFCSGEHLNNLFKVKLSDEDGSFTSGTTELKSGSGSPLTFTVPTNLTSSDLYRIRVESTKPGIVSPDNGADLVLNNIQVDITSTDATTFIATGLGGVEPYEYSLNGTTFSTTNQFTGLTPGNDYTIYVRDANGCEESKTFSFNPPMDCNTLLAAGGQGTTFTTHYLGSVPGQVFVSYEMYPNPDQMDVYYDGNLVASTNTLVSNLGALSFYYDPPADGPFHCVIRIYAPNSGTRWDYIAGCPISDDNQIISNNTLTTCAVTLVSPNFPDNYPDNANVTQILLPADPSKTLKYSFDFIGTESNDELNVYNGENAQSDLIDTYSGYSYKPSSLMGFATNSNGALTFQFTSNGWTNGPGFVINAECVDKTSGINPLTETPVTTCDYLVSTPNYPENYDNNLDITQTFTPGTTGHKLYISFLEFYTENYDKLYIYDGNSTSSPLLATYKDKFIPEDVYATNAEGQLTLRFTSGGYTNYKGILAQLKCYAPAGFLSFNIPGQISQTVIDDNNFKIYITMPANTNLANLIPLFSVLQGATVKVNTTIQTSGVTANDFSNTVTYTITNNETTQDWEVIISTGTSNTFTNSISPSADQNININTNGTTLTVTESEIADSREWKYSTTSNGSFVSFETPQTDLSYTPNFSTSGTYYIACFSTKDSETVKSNEVIIVVNSGTSPLVTLSETSLVFGYVTAGTTSTAQTYTVEGSNLTSDIIITAPSGFEVSEYGTTYVSSLTLTQTSGTVSQTTIHVQFTPAAEQAYSGNVSHESTGATTVNLAVSGTGISSVDYCDAGSDNSSFEYIGYVVMGSIDNSSGASSYSDYTAFSTDVYPGNSQSFTVTSVNGYNTDHVLIWVDWNRDGDFEDSGENAFTSSEGLGPYSGTIDIPVNATSDSVRVRIRLEDNSNSPVNSPCGNSGYGEVEDYTINIVENVSYSVTFTVNDGSNAISGANVIINEVTKTTDSSGETSFEMDPGSYTYDITAVGYNNERGDIDVVDTDINEVVTLSINTGIDDVDFELIKIYPNPSKGIFYFEANNHLNTNLIVKIIDVNGQVIYANYQITKTIEKIDLSNYAKGIYFIQVRSDKYFKTEKLIIE